VTGVQTGALPICTNCRVKAAWREVPECLVKFKSR